MYALLFLLTVASALENCTEYCKNVTSSSILEKNPNCNCGNKKIPLSLTDLVKQGITANSNTKEVLYEPAFMYNNNDELLFTPPIESVRSSSKYDMNSNRDPTQSTLFNEIVSKDEARHTGSPLYLDIAIQENHNETKAANKHIKINGVDFNEKDLIECIDLHVMLLFRKNNMTFVYEIHDSDMIDKYINMSDTKLLNTIHTKCNKTLNVIGQSIRDIKNTLPKKLLYQSNSHHDDDSENLWIVPTVTPDITSTISYDSTIYTTETNESPPSLVYRSKNSVNSKTKNLTTSGHLKQGISSQSSTTKYEPSKETEADSQYENKNDSVRIVDATISGLLDEKSPVDPETSYLIDETESDISTTSSSETDLDNLSNRNSDVSTTIIVPLEAPNVQFRNHERSLLQEEIEIPKIVSIELINEISSAVNGYENMTTNDFVENRIEDIDNLALGNEFRTAAVDEYTTPAESTSTTINSEVLSGQLYFRFENYDVPARFIQDTNGNLFISMDGMELCSKLNRS